MKTTLLLVILFVATAYCTGCVKSGTIENGNDIPDEVIARVQSLNFSTDNLQRTEGGYIAEGDMFLSNEFLQSNTQTTHYLTQHEEHFRTSNLVTGLPRTITIRYTGATTSFSNAINAAIARYNAQALQLRFQRITAGAANITVSNVSGVAYNALAGFPSGGNPYNSIRINTAISTLPAGTLTTLIAHEIGHCIGFAHTDTQNPISCPAGTPPETPGGLGYILIFGTPSDPNLDPNSWMMRCISSGIDRPFTFYDRQALNLVY